MKLLFFFLALFLFSCQKHISNVQPSDRWQITDELILNGKMSEGGASTALLLADNSIAVWDNTRQQRIALWPSHQLLSNSTELYFSASGEYILSANNASVQVWQVGQRNALGSLNLSRHLGDASVSAVAFWDAPHRLIIGTSGGAIIFADVQHNHYQINTSHTAEVRHITLTRDKLVMFSGGNDGQVIKWDLPNAKPVATQSLPHRITSLAVGTPNQVFISDALKDQVIWNSDRLQSSENLDYHERHKWFRDALFTSDNRWLITATPKSTMYMWNTQGMSLHAQWDIEAQGFGSTLADMTMTGTQTLRTLSSDGVIENWHLPVSAQSQP